MRICNSKTFIGPLPFTNISRGMSPPTVQKPNGKPWWVQEIPFMGFQEEKPIYFLTF